MTRATSLDCVPYNPAIHYYRGELVPRFYPPVLRLLDCGTDMFPRSEQVIVNTTGQVENLLRSNYLNVDQLAAIMSSVLFPYSREIVDRVVNRTSENWIGFSMGIYWGQLPLTILSEILNTHNIIFDTSITQTRGERGKRISSIGFRLNRELY
jgi:hypothetical protein